MYLDNIDAQQVMQTDSDVSRIQGPGKATDILTSNYIPDWWESAFQRISALLELPENWDSYGARRIDRNLAYDAVSILQDVAHPDIPEPSIVPTVRGGIQFEWHSNNIDLEFEVVAPTSIIASYEDSETGDAWENELKFDLGPISEVVRTLVNRRRRLKAA